MNLYIEKKKIPNVIINFCFLIITLILLYNKDNIKNVHVVFILILGLLLILKNILLSN